MQSINDNLVILNISGSTREHGQVIINFSRAPEDDSLLFGFKNKGFVSGKYRWLSQRVSVILNPKVSCNHFSHIFSGFCTQLHGRLVGL